MNKTFVMVILTLFLSAIVGNVYGEEGTGTGLSISSGKYKMYQLEEGTGFVAWKQKGARLSESGGAEFHNMSTNCSGIVLWEKGVGTTLGYCIGIVPDGDKILYEVTEANVKPGPGPKKGKIRFLGGTGKFAGMEGEGEYTGYNVQPAEEGTYQSVSKSKSNYKLP